jgi:hypothetical protein
MYIEPKGAKQMKEREFTYQDGIVEGRLIENGFFGIGKDMFVCRTDNSLYVVTHPEKGASTLEVFQTNSQQPENEMEYSDYIRWVREDSESNQPIDVHGHIVYIIEVAKISKAFYK